MAKAEPIRDKRQVRYIIAELEKDKSKIGVNRYLLFMTGVFTGRRVSDIVTLRVRDVRGKDGFTFTEKKTGKKAEIYFPAKLKAAYDEYLKDKEPEDWVFESDKKDRVDKQARHITTRTAYNYMKRIQEIAGIEGDVSVGTHTMRKTFGYTYYRETGDLAMLMSLFNHAEPATTLIYIGIAADDRRKAAKRVDGMYED